MVKETLLGLQMLSAEYIDKGSADLEQDLDIDQREIEICIIIK